MELGQVFVEATLVVIIKYCGRLANVDETELVVLVLGSFHLIGLRPNSQDYMWVAFIIGVFVPQHSRLAIQREVLLDVVIRQAILAVPDIVGYVVYGVLPCVEDGVVMPKLQSIFHSMNYYFL